MDSCGARRRASARGQQPLSAGTGHKESPCMQTLPDLSQSLPKELHARVAEFRVETYPSASNCAECGGLLLYWGRDGSGGQTLRQFLESRTLQREGRGFVSLCLTCAPWPAPEARELTNGTSTLFGEDGINERLFPHSSP